MKTEAYNEDAIRVLLHPDVQIGVARRVHANYGVHAVSYIDGGLHVVQGVHHDFCAQGDTEEEAVRLVNIEIDFHKKRGLSFPQAPPSVFVLVWKMARDPSDEQRR